VCDLISPLIRLSYQLTLIYSLSGDYFIGLKKVEQVPTFSNDVTLDDSAISSFSVNGELDDDEKICYRLDSNKVSDKTCLADEEQFLCQAKFHRPT